jgi:DNA-binding NtrC family response regulator
MVRRVSPSTTPHRVAGLPVRTLTLQVIAGPDQGKALEPTAERVTVGTATGNDLCLTDSTVSRYHLELSRQGDRVEVLDPGSTNGTLVGQMLVQRAMVVPGTVLQLGRTSLKVGEGATVTLELSEGDGLGELRGGTPVMRRLFAKVQKLAQTEASVLLVGESGTGKELIARALHEEGARSERPFVTVDCGSLSPGLVASELFGHERGAFTGADKRHVGAFERAHGGTLFLDEVGELPAQLQATLLGALERRRFRRVGGTEEIEVDVRVVSATHRDLRAEVNAGTFRLDLYYRLAVVRLEVPALRERRDDIPLLAEQFLREAGYEGALSTVLPDDALEALLTHHWPGNVRELRNFVEAALATGEAPPLEASAGAAAAAKPAGPSADPLELGYREARRRVLDGFELSYLKALIERTSGNVSLAARMAKMDRSHLIDLLHRHKLR